MVVTAASRFWAYGGNARSAQACPSAATGDAEAQTDVPTAQCPGSTRAARGCRGGDHDGGIHGFDERVRVVEGADDDVCRAQQARGTVPGLKASYASGGLHAPRIRCGRMFLPSLAFIVVATDPRPHERDWYPQRSKNPELDTKRGARTTESWFLTPAAEAARVLRRSSGRRSPWPGQTHLAIGTWGGTPATVATKRWNELSPRTRRLIIIGGVFEGVAQGGPPSSISGGDRRTKSGVRSVAGQRPSCSSNSMGGVRLRTSGTEDGGPDLAAPPSGLTITDGRPRAGPVVGLKEELLGFPG